MRMRETQQTTASIHGKKSTRSPKIYKGQREFITKKSEGQERSTGKEKRHFIIITIIIIIII
jgi:hypothetical protein